MRNIVITILSLFAFFYFTYCSKDTIYEDFVSPVSEILSIEKVSELDYVINMSVNKGVGAVLKDKYIFVEDLTAPEMSFAHEITLDGESNIKTTITLGSKHDYKIQVILKSEKNEYKSNLMYLYLSENSQSNGFIDVEFPDLGTFFRDISDNVGYTINLNEGAHLHFNYKWLPNTAVPIEVKVNEKVLLKDSLTFDYWIFDNIHKMFFVSAYIEFKDIAIGDHQVDILLDGKASVMREKVRVLEGNVSYLSFDSAPKSWQTIYPDSKIPALYLNKLFYFSRDKDAIYKVASFDYINKKWKQEKEIALPLNDYYLTGADIQIETSLYTQILRDSIYYIQGEVWPKRTYVLEIWKYDNSKNTIQKETQYPGKAYYDLPFFSDGENIYTGAGFTEGSIGIEAERDFWIYDLNNRKWNRKNDVPIYFNTDSGISTLFVDNVIYLFTRYKELWKYTPLSDRWEKLSTMGGGSYYRDKSSLLYLEGDLYIVGGATAPSGIAPDNSYLEDVWQYNIKTNTWILKTFFTPGYYKYPAFISNNKIYSTNHNIFEDFKFVEIQ